MNTLVLGGCGFIGSHIVDLLLDAGHKVRVVDQSPEQFRQPLTDVDYRLMDYTNASELEAALDGIETVIHAISSTVPGTSNKDTQADIRNNLLGFIRLLELLKKQGIHRIVFLSSGGTVYGTPDIIPIPENHPLNPLCSYGVVKVAIEKYLFMYQHLYGLRPIVIRPANPYGPRQGHSGVQGVISTFLADVLKGRPLNVWGDGSTVRDFFHVQDLAKLCVTAAESDQSGIFNAGSGCGHSIREIINIISEITGVAADVRFSDARTCDVEKVVLDIKKAKNAFNWSPDISLDQGVRDHWQWLRGSVDKNRI